MKAFGVRTVRGWVSLPIIVLLLAISTVSVQYQQRLQASYQWRGQLNDIENEQQIWADFEQAFVLSPSFSSATLSPCSGFCALTLFGQEKTWQKDAQTLSYQWQRDEFIQQETGETVVSYRLCASQNQQAYRCWWWRGDTLLSKGWVTASY